MNTEFPCFEMKSVLGTDLHSHGAVLNNADITTNSGDVFSNSVYFGTIKNVVKDILTISYLFIHLPFLPN